MRGTEFERLVLWALCLILKYHIGGQVAETNRWFTSYAIWKDGR